MSASSTSDSFLQKKTEELQFLVQNPTLYHPSVVVEAERELRRRGVSQPQQPAPPVTRMSVPEDNYSERSSPTWLSWWPAGALAIAVVGLGWWGLKAPSPSPAKIPQKTIAAKAEPIVLEAVKTKALPDFEAITATQVAQVRRQMSATDRADTTATGRYLRMARRYWIAENSAVYLTAQAKGDSASSVFSGQVDLTMERISWFMRAKAYNQSLTPSMESGLSLMQQGLTLRRNALIVLKSNYEAELPLLNNEVVQADQEASSIADELRGKYQRKAAIQGNISEL